MKLLLSFSFLFLFFCAKTQTSDSILLNEHISSYIYIYKISNSEAEKIYKKNKIEYKEKYFSNLIDSVKYNDYETYQFPNGHFISQIIKNDIIHYTLESHAQFDVTVLNNNRDLNLLVHKPNGEKITTANITLHSKKIKLDTKTNTYKLNKTNKKGTLRVEVNGNVLYYQINRDRNNPLILRLTKSIVQNEVTHTIFHKSPIKYIYYPIKKVFSLPKRVFYFFRYGPRYSFYSIRNKIENLYYWFNTKEGDIKSINSHQRKHRSSISRNKPKYKPNDTLFTKIFIAKHNGRRLRRKVKFIVADDYHGSQKIIYSEKIEASSPGSYHTYTHLIDSLNLKLDKKYKLIYKPLLGRKIYNNDYFYFEEYKLDNITWSVEQEDENIYFPDSVKINVTGTEANNQPLTLGSAEIIVSCKSVMKTFNTFTSIPDTIFKTKKQLNSNGRCEFTISPDSLPNINGSYSVKVITKDINNELQYFEKSFTYYKHKEHFTFEKNADTLQICYLNNSDTVEQTVKIYSYTADKKQHKIDTIILPAKLKINPFTNSIKVTNDSHSETYNFANMSDGIFIDGYYANDSVFFNITNPYKLPILYEIFEKAKRIERDTCINLNFSKRAEKKKEYFISYQYIWGGIAQNKKEYVIPQKRVLHITNIHKKNVQPGDTLEFTILVKDYQDNPVKNANITSWAYNSKFKSHTPNYPIRWQEKIKTPKNINSFSLEEKKQYSIHKSIGYNNLSKYNLSDIPFYKFRYPGREISVFYIPNNQDFSEFAPFVFKNGKPQSIHIIYENSIPVFFGLCTNNTYSFKSKRNDSTQISIRLNKHEVSLPNIKMKKGYKAIISLDIDSCSKCKIREKTTEASWNERKIISNKICEINHPKKHFTLIKSGDKRFLEKNFSNYGYYYNSAPYRIGPINTDSITIIDFYNNNFTHIPFFPHSNITVENNYSYIQPMQKDIFIHKNKFFSKKKTTHFPSYYHNQQNLNINDFVLSNDYIANNWDTFKKHILYYDAPKKKYYQSNFFIHNTKPNINPDKKLLRIILKSTTDSSNFIINKGNHLDMHINKSDNYVLALYFQDNTYWASDTLSIKKSQQNYYRIPDSIEYKTDFNLISYQYLFPDFHNTLLSTKITQTNSTDIFSSTEPSGNKHYKTISGHIFDTKGNPIAYADIIEKGTSNGTFSDINGEWTLRVKKDAIININFLGYETATVSTSGISIFAIELEEAPIELSSVVRIGYMNSKKEDVTGTITVNETLQGRSPGVQVQSNSGSPGFNSDIIIRGRGTTGNNAPLYIIDGVIMENMPDDLSPDMISSINILKDSKSLSIYGARESSGVIVITTSGYQHNNILQGNNTHERQSFQIRKKFRDYAYWEPNINTNKQGVAKVKVVIPDDITSWDNYVIAHAKNKRSGMLKTSFVSSKSIISELSVPDFLISGDTCNIKGISKNYTPDTIPATQLFYINDSIQKQKEIALHNTSVDSLHVFSNNTDSLSVMFETKTAYNYSDAERRDIPVFKAGTRKTHGKFHVINSDTTIWIHSDSLERELTIHITNTQNQIFTEEIHTLRKYPHLCNEQIASKLIAYLLLEDLYTSENKAFRHSRAISKLIQQLQKNNYNSGGWAWWNKNTPVLWITTHVTKALMMAEERGYKVDKWDNIYLPLRHFYNSLNNNHSNYEKLRLLSALYDYNSLQDTTLLFSIEKNPQLSDYEKLLIIELRQKYNLDYEIDSVINKANHSYINGMYWGENRYFFHSNSIQQSLCAYRILKKDTTHTVDTDLIYRYILHEREKRGKWMNTYESAEILSTFIEKENISIQPKASLIKIPQHSISISSFPYSSKLFVKDSVQMHINTQSVVSINASYDTWETEPKINEEYFVINSEFSTKNDYLKQGEKTLLTITVEAKKDAEYVMLEIPIPAGCMYNSKEQKYNESHREYFKDKTIIYLDKLKTGTHTFEVDLQTRFSGRFIINPARIELMYFPVFYSNNSLKSIKIK